MRLLIIIFLSFFISSSIIAKVEKSKLKECLSTREFVTSLEYLKDNKDFGIKSRDAFKVAEHVATGCTGSAKRFIKIVSMLTQASIDTSSAIKIGKLFAIQNDNLTNNFIEIFKTSYLKKYLDLDVNRSIEIALSLSVDIQKEKSDRALKDFKGIASFCLDGKLGLGHQFCSELASRVALSGIKFSRRVGPAFIDTYNFLISKYGPRYPVDKTLEIAERIVQFGPTSYENFKHGYMYALKESGLNLSTPKALKFGIKMAVLSSFKKLP